MDKDRQNLLRHLFAIITAALEDALEPALAGQHPALDAHEAARLANALATAATDLKTLAEAAAVIAKG